MASFATDFHATLDELIAVAGKWMATYPIFALAQSFPPVRIQPLPLNKVNEILRQPDIDEVLFTEAPVTCPGTSVSDALKEHPNGLVFQLGKLQPQGLPQSRLSTMDASPLWKKMNAELKKLTTAGATLICENGLQPFDRNARFTAGAKALAASGVPLRQSAQSMKFHYLPK